MIFQISGDISEYDPDLVEAYDIIAADLPHLESESDFKSENLIDSERFLILSDYGLDPKFANVNSF